MNGNVSHTVYAQFVEKQWFAHVNVVITAYYCYKQQTIFLDNVFTLNMEKATINSFQWNYSFISELVPLKVLIAC